MHHENVCKGTEESSFSDYVRCSQYEQYDTQYDIKYSFGLHLTPRFKTYLKPWARAAHAFNRGGGYCPLPPQLEPIVRPFARLDL